MIGWFLSTSKIVLFITMYVVLEGGSERKRRENKREGRRKEEGESRGGGECLDLFFR